jgi:hypothetical protein
VSEKEETETKAKESAGITRMKPITGRRHGAPFAFGAPRQGEVFLLFLS